MSHYAAARRPKRILSTTIALKPLTSGRKRCSIVDENSIDNIIQCFVGRAGGRNQIHIPER